MVELIDPVERGQFDRFDGAPRSTSVDDLGLVETDDRLGPGVDAPICQDRRGGTLRSIDVCCTQPVIIDEGVVDFSSDESLKATDNVFLRQPNSGVVSCWFFGALARAERRWYTVFDAELFIDWALPGFSWGIINLT